MENNSSVVIYTTKDGQTQLDVILAVGYRVRSQRGIQFRVWASQLTEEYQKYQAKTLSAVEQDYLETVKVLAEKVER